MATLTSEKVLCTTCEKISGLFTCRGCQKDFCTQHVNEHRQELHKQMDELTLDYDRFRQHLTDQINDSRLHPLMIQIDQWEQQSMEKIHQIANDARQQLQSIISEYTMKLRETLTKIGDELYKARQNDDFFEINLQQWIEQLHQMKQDLTNPPNIKIRQDHSSVIPTITHVLFTNEIFAQAIGHIQIEDDDQVIFKTQGHGHATARGKGTYNVGQHRFRFKIEEYDVHKWIFIGIISKDVTMETNSYCSQSCCGWARWNPSYLNSSRRRKRSNGYINDIEKNDIVELFLDCDQRIIRLQNERTGSMNELQIELNKCPFPWQLNFDLFYLNDRIRILQT